MIRDTQQPAHAGHRPPAVAPTPPDEAAAAQARRDRAARAGRAPKPGQRGVRLNRRDHAALATLFFVDWMDVAGLRALHYQTANHKTVLNRLNRVAGDPSGNLVKISLPIETAALAASGVATTTARHTFYALSPKARGVVARRLARDGLDAPLLYASGREPDKSNPEFAGLDEPEPARANHLKKICELYVEVMPALFSTLGPPGPKTWFWRNERRAHRSYGLGSRFYAYRPDAEVVVALPASPSDAPDAPPRHAHLLIEVQTEASHKGPGAIEEKLVSHARAFPNVGQGADPATPEVYRALYWATETEAHKDAAFGGAERLDIQNCAAGTLREVAQFIVADALDPASLL